MVRLVVFLGVALLLVAMPLAYYYLNQGQEVSENVVVKGSFRVTAYFKDLSENKTSAQDELTVSNAVSVEQIKSLANEDLIVEREFSSLSGFTATVSGGKLNELQSNPNLDVYVDRKNYAKSGVLPE